MLQMCGSLGLCHRERRLPREQVLSVGDGDLDPPFRKACRCIDWLFRRMTIAHLDEVDQA